jgi:hypothetical protein
MAQAPEITIHQLEARIKRLEKCCEEEKIEDGSIKIIVRDMFGKRYSIYVKPTDPCQTIIDKYKLKLLKEHKWPVNENEYKYILKYLGNDVDVSQTIEDIGLGIESTLYIMLKENNTNELRQKIEDLEKCCKEFKKMQIGDMISFSGIMPNNLIYTNMLLRGSSISNVLKHIFKDKDNFQNFIEILENIDVIDDINIYFSIQQIIGAILQLFRQNSHYNTITDEQFEILVRLFIRKKWYIQSSNQKLYFDDVDFVTKYYTTLSPKREREIEYEKKFEEIIKRSKIIKPTGEESKEDDRKGESKEDGKKLRNSIKKSYKKSKKFMSKSKLKLKSKRNKSRRKSIRKKS